MKRFLPIFLALIIIFGNLPFLQENKVEAVGIDTAVKIVAGSEAELMLEGIAERAGVKYATKSAEEKAFLRWNYDLQSFYRTEDAAMKTRLADWKTAVDSAPKTPMPNNPGWSKAIISGAMFMTGLDLIYNGYLSFNNAYQSTKAVQVMEDAFKVGNAYQSGYGIQFLGFANGSTGGKPWTQWGLYSYDLTPLYNVTEGFYNGTELNYFVVKSIGTSSVVVDATWGGVSKVSNQFVSWTPVTNMTVRVPATNTDLITGLYTPTQTDVPDISKVDPLVADPIKETGIDPLPSVLPVPDTVEIAIPDSGTYPDPETSTETTPNATPVGEPLSPPDTGDGGGDGGDTGDTGDTPPKIDWNKLKPVLATLKTVFPFSIPWDVQDFLSQFNVDPEVPKIPIKIDKQLPLPGGQTFPFKMDFTIDFSMFDVLAKITRWGLIIVFDIYLITSLRKYTPD